MISTAVFCSFIQTEAIADHCDNLPVRQSDYSISDDQQLSMTGRELVSPGHAITDTVASTKLNRKSQNLNRSKNRLELNFPEGTLVIEVCRNDIFHIQYFPGNPVTLPPNEMVSKKDWSTTPYRFEESEQFLVIITDRYQLQINRTNGALSFLNSRGEIILTEPLEGGKMLLPARLLREDTWNIQQIILCPAHEPIYCLGQYQEGLMNWKGVFRRLQQYNTVVAVPFYLSNKGYGILWNNSSLTELNPDRQELEFWISASWQKHWSRYLSQAAGTYVFIMDSIYNSGFVNLSLNGQKIIDLDYDVIPGWLCGRATLEANKEYEIEIIGQFKKLFVQTPAMQQQTKIWSEIGEAIDYYFIGGTEPDQVISGMRTITGKAPLLPKWAFGFTQCRYTYDSQEKMLGVAQEYRQRKIPVDVVVQDMNYWTNTPEKNLWGSHLFDPVRYDDPSGMFQDLHLKYHVHTLISVWPRINRDTDLFDQFNTQNYLLRLNVPDEAHQITGDSTNAIVDPYIPGARQLFWKYIKERLWDSGADGWWLDATEPEWGYDYYYSLPAAGSGARLRNNYSLMLAKAVYEGQRSISSDRRVYILTRSAFPGQQRFAAVTWSGDIGITWNTYRQQIPAGLNFCLSGLPYWTHDIGGFRPYFRLFSSPYRELLVRWFQFGVFNPIFRVHGCRDTELWQTGEEAENIMVAYDKFRYRLLPYIYSLAGWVYLNDYTVMRGLVMDFPSDLQVIDITDQFMFGPSFLINPVTEPQTNSRKLYLPQLKGGWYDFWSGEIMEGGKVIIASAPLDRLPIFIPAGSIIPLGPELQFATEKPADPIELRIYPGVDGDFILFEDENDGYNYETGKYSTIKISWNDREQKLTFGKREGSFKGMLKQREFHIIWVRKNAGIGFKSDTRADMVVLYNGEMLRLKKELK